MRLRPKASPGQGLQRLGTYVHKSPFLHGVYSDPLAAPDKCLRLTSTDITTWDLLSVKQLVRDAEKREQAKGYANAAFLFNEAHALIEEARASTDEKHAIQNYEMMAIYTELRVYENLGYALNVTNPVNCDPIQQRYVMTPTMVEEVKDFQNRTDISPEGYLDYPTMRNLVIYLD